MPINDAWKEIEDLHRAVTSARPRLLHVHRPIYLHDRAPAGNRKVCPCGCASTQAVRVEVREHMDVLIDRIKGHRRIRKPYNAAAFDRVAARAHRLEMPVRCYDEQLAPIVDREHKIIGVFGGNRAGKSEVGKEALVDRWAEMGGKGAMAFWVSPTREDTQVAVRKLVTGERTNRWCRPAFPKDLVRYFPKTELSKPQAIILVDGSRIELKYAGRKGRNLKGRSIFFGNLDEGCECPHEINWTILLNRTMDSGGQVMTTTTPVAGHWLKKLADEGVPYHALANNLIPTERVTATLSCERNPWQPPEEVQRTIDSLGGVEDPRVQREVFGRWVAEGNRMWRHWRTATHQFEGIGHDPAEYKLHNITPIAARGLFDKGARLDMLGGWDCNDFPQSLVLGHVCVREQADASDPDKWILVIMDEIVIRATIEQFADHLVDFPKRLGRPQWLERLSIVGDKNTCYEDTRVNRVGQGADADVLRRRGFAVRPPAYQKDQPWNPSIRDRCNLLHRLMHEKRILVHGRCKNVLNAIDEQICDERGEPVKEHGKRSDRLAGATEGVGYLAYAVFHHATVRPQGRIQW